MDALFDQLGGQVFFDDLVDRFYARVDQDPVLRHMYPDDLTEPKENLALFLGQFWGGPPAYMDKRGHPRMRMRHVPFVIDQEARDAWFQHMAAAVQESPVDQASIDEMLRYFDTSATFLMNA